VGAEHRISVRTVETISSLDRQGWDALDHGRAPFLRSGFLRALEDSDSIGPGTGWNPVYFLVEDGKTLIGAAAGFIKTDSYGEYIFDWAWASAARRAGLRYYPKLTFAAPVTPATGHRILSRPGAPASERDLVIRAVVAGALEVAETVDCSSVHWLFCTDEEADALESIGFARRSTYQYHWHNRGYGSFDDFLATMTARKRKQIRRERRRAIEAAGPVEFIEGGDLDEATLDQMDRFYRDNVQAHGGFDYLRPGFFHRLAELAPEYLRYARAGDLGGAIFLETDEALYGRYWGCSEFVEFLHFEVAYYAGIERCIERGTPLFEAGAQGGHKLLRGFEPSLTNSCHFFRDPRFDAAIRNYLVQEAAEVAGEMLRLAEIGPYKKE
jgi:predicted N-acyltransferase